MNWLRRLRASYLLARNRTAEAAALYREILRSEPVHMPGLLTVLADCTKRDAVEEAIEVATRALAIDKCHFMALQTLGWAYAAEGNHAAARIAIAEALAQFNAQELGTSSGTLQTIDRALGYAARVPWVRSRVPKTATGLRVADAATDSLNAWKRWAEEYLVSQT